MVEKFAVGCLQVEVHDNRAALGAAAAQRVADLMRRLILERGQVHVIFAAAPSQNEFLSALCRQPNLDWRRVVAMHMDEYIGLPGDVSQSFGRFLHERLFDVVRPGTVHYIDGMATDMEAECRRYSAILQANPVDIVCAGIGENGHLAFNDPPVADFTDPESVKVVELERRCREQQVHDGCFSSFEQVPTRALTLTIPALMSARWMACVVPGPTKADAVAHTLSDPIATACPATVMRRHENAVLYLDRHSAALLRR